MSGSVRVNTTKTGLIVGITAAIAICALFIGYGLWEGDKYERHAKNNIADYAEYTRKKIADTCVGILPLEAAECRYEAYDAQREYRHNQRDLIAQKQSALWAYIMGAAAVIGIALSAVGVWLVKTTFDETRKSNAISEEGVEIQALYGRGYLAGVWGWIMEKNGVLVAEMYGGGGEKNDICLQSVRWSLLESCAYPKKLQHFLSVSKMCPPNQSGPIFDIDLSACNVASGIFLSGVANYMTIGRNFEYYFCFRVSPIDEGDTNPNCKFRLINAKGEDWPDNT